MINNTGFENILIFSHSQEDTVGVDDELLEYITHKVKTSCLFKFPFLYSSDGSIKVTLSDSFGTKQNYSSLLRFYKPDIVSYVKDFIYAFFYCAKYIKRNSLVVCTDNILTVATSIPLYFARIFGVKVTNVYYLIDYTPRRFTSSIINLVYEFVDKLAFYCTDYVWVLNKKMVTGRVVDKGYPTRTDNIIVVPHGNNSHKYNDLDYKKFDLFNIAYLGGIFKSKGAELFTQIIKELVETGHKSATLHVIGSGDLDYLSDCVKSDKIENNVVLYGRVSDQKDVEQILLRCAVAIAPYNPHDKNSFSYYADPGKVKIYLGCGLPVVITEVPEIYKTIRKQNAGLVADYSAKDFSKKIVVLLNDISTYRRNAQKLGEQYSWLKIFDKTFFVMKRKIQSQKTYNAKL